MTAIGVLRVVLPIPVRAWRARCRWRGSVRVWGGGGAARASPCASAAGASERRLGSGRTRAMSEGGDSGSGDSEGGGSCGRHSAEHKALRKAAKKSQKAEKRAKR
jgi:hypothetical protein